MRTGEGRHALHKALPFGICLAVGRRTVRTLPPEIRQLVLQLLPGLCRQISQLAGRHHLDSLSRLNDAFCLRIIPCRNAAHLIAIAQFRRTEEAAVDLRSLRTHLKHELHRRIGAIGPGLHTESQILHQRTLDF